MAESGDLEFGSCSQICFFSKHVFFAGLKKWNRTRGAFSTSILLQEFDTWDPDIFQNLKCSKSRVPAIQKMLILSETASNHDLAAGAICHLFFLWAGC